MMETCVMSITVIDKSNHCRTLLVKNKIIQICIENCINDMLRQVCPTIYDRGEIEVYIELKSSGGDINIFEIESVQTLADVLEFDSKFNFLQLSVKNKNEIDIDHEPSSSKENAFDKLMHRSLKDPKAKGVVTGK